MTTKKFLNDTWKKIETRITANKFWVFVRTEQLPQKQGLIWLPARAANFYGEHPHLVIVTATVVATGPAVQEVKPGDRVAFQRLHFVRTHTIDKKEQDFVGAINFKDILGFVE